jgi:murein DD-endopeptidase MepM/ murein hydrolase activator NlpD
MRSAVMALLFVLSATANSTAAPDAAHHLDLALPTDNDALFRGDGPGFYQVVARDFQGVESTPWEGGQYGFVRDPIETPSGIVYKRFHEGIDIRPLYRDARGEPLDEVRAISEGKVVHTNQVPGFSNYGKFVVIEHRWDGANYYSLYAHLHDIVVHPGEQVKRGERIGIMGYTGEGIDRERAHVHLELNLLLSRKFESWYDVYFRNDPNRHGLYNGLNLAGLDIARLYLALRERPALTIPEFLARETTFYKVTLPDSKSFDLPKRYPWLLKTARSSERKSWEVSFSQSGVPLKVEPSSKVVTAPELSYFKKSSGKYSDLTRDILAGHGDRAFLSESGKSFMRLLIYPD